jgi:hypothetical protein
MSNRTINEIFEAMLNGAQTREDEVAVASMAITKNITDFAKQMRFPPSILFEAVFDSMAAYADALMAEDGPISKDMATKAETRDTVQKIVENFHKEINAMANVSRLEEEAKA